MSHFEKCPLYNCRRQPAIGGIKENKDTKIFRSVPAWGPPPQPNPMKYFRGVPLPEITVSYKPNGKYYTIGDL
jgi:hypothetical protein